MNTEEWFRNKLELFKEDFEFRLETLILDITEKISERMKQKDISRAKLAEILNVSPPAVTKILNGNSNFTLKTLLFLADALELDLNIEFRKKGVNISQPIYEVTLASPQEKLGYDVSTATISTSITTTASTLFTLFEPEEIALPDAAKDFQLMGVKNGY